jgi:hypothetical protein
MKTVVYLLAESEETFWNEHPTWESEGRVELSRKTRQCFSDSGSSLPEI